MTLENWLKDSLNAKWYVEQMKLGNYGVAQSDGTGVYNDFVDSAAGELGLGDRWLKSKNGYWDESMGVGLGWKSNIKKLCDFIAANGFSDEGLTVKGEDKIWTVDGVSTRRDARRLQRLRRPVQGRVCGGAHRLTERFYKKIYVASP